MVPPAETIRRFNRYYTQRIGILSDRYLGQSRPLAQARVLFEIGEDQLPVSELRIRLGLDSGYLSRLLRSLEREQLVTVIADSSDRRARIAVLTRSGRRELRLLNERSTAAAADLLASLSTPERERLLTAVQAVHRILRNAEVTVDEVDPDSADAQRCLRSYAAELDERFPEGFAVSALMSPEEIRTGAGVCLVARDAHQAVGCGVLRPIDRGTAEIKHLWVAPDARGIGVSRRVLSELERIALARGMTTVRLDTHSVLTEAIHLYRTSGYTEIPAYGTNPHAHVWFEKYVPPVGVEPTLQPF
jgi:DNA-binding MarR family transcriptional regulator/ribosomal protein S18 acetylase RimI-like enzyme